MADDKTEKRDRLRLIRSENVGPVTWRKLMDTYGSATRALDMLPTLANRGGRGRGIRIATIETVMEEKAALKAMGARLLFLGDDRYPAPLAALEDAPPVLTVLGSPALLHRPCVAIVGARDASAGACRFAAGLAADLGAAGLVVVSGLARGLDTAAHTGALATGTVAVMAGGADVIYPAGNTGLYHRIREAGAIVSELPPGEKPLARHFPRRNRIVSGLCLGVVVVEGLPRSGSLLTARLAADQGREVMAVPGSPHDPRAHGPNGLIRDGATLVETADDVLRVLAPFHGAGISETRPGSFAIAPEPPPADALVDQARPGLVSALGRDPIPVDELVRQCQLSATVVSVILLELELAGRLTRYPGHRVALRPAA